MNHKDNFKGLCPVCYKPIFNIEETTVLNSDEGSETYHSSCVKNWLNQKQSDGHSVEVATSILEKYSHVFVGSNREKIQTWMNSQTRDWWSTGQSMRQMRESAGISLNDTARYLGVSIARLKRFENGGAVRDAKLLRSAYINLTTFFENQRKKVLIENDYGMLYNQYQFLLQNYTNLYNEHFSIAITNDSKKEQECEAE